MPRETEKSERDPAPAGLVAQYRAIGPAAVLAALLCAPRSRITVASPAAKAS